MPLSKKIEEYFHISVICQILKKAQTKLLASRFSRYCVLKGDE
jgi:hypothetical protein